MNLQKFFDLYGHSSRNGNLYLYRKGYMLLITIPQYSQLRSMSTVMCFKSTSGKALTVESNLHIAIDTALSEGSSMNSIIASNLLEAIPLKTGNVLGLLRDMEFADNFEITTMVGVFPQKSLVFIPVQSSKDEVVVESEKLTQEFSDKEIVEKPKVQRKSRAKIQVTSVTI